MVFHLKPGADLGGGDLVDLKKVDIIFEIFSKNRPLLEKILDTPLFKTILNFSKLFL